ADRFGGIRVLLVFYLGVTLCLVTLGGLLGLSMLSVLPVPPLAVAVVLLFLTMGLLGMGNGSVFQLVPLRFPKEIGVITGIVGAAGGLGGFFLPTLLGGLKEFTGSFAGGFVAFALLGCFGCATALLYVSRKWEGSFVGQGGLAAG